MYEPREDSFLLSKIVESKAKSLSVLDVGCGSGVQMETALSCGAASAVGVDIDKESLDFCRRKGLDVIESNLFENVSGRFDLIVFNPPYLPEDEREDRESGRATSGGVKGDEIIVRFLREVCDYLEKDGRILLVVSSLTPLEEIERVMEEVKWKKKVVASEKFFMEVLEVWEIRKA